MSRSTRMVKLIFLMGFVSITALAAPFMGSDVQPSSLTVLNDFLHSVFPELFDKGWYLDVSVFQPIDGPWQQIYETRFKVTSGPPVHGDRTIDLATGKWFTEETTTNMEGFFQVNPESQIEHVSIWDSDLVYSKQNNSVHELVESHPE